MVNNKTVDRKLEEKASASTRAHSIDQTRVAPFLLPVKRSWKPSSALRYFLSLYFLRMNVARCSTEAPLWTSSSKGRLAAQKLFAFLFPTSRKS
ncbi:hypothetical protein EYF80_026570 [Liparis tanakae]|uniref:Uncharacterized protein n=1 Tax=Liparis tanakae TaxID=230148 RepID=A0A4Z2HBF9_9TELE|nr:hypothetical protein EYF80_026570 [Liparis tanakae]